jgi:hypothetical protein
VYKENAKENHLQNRPMGCVVRSGHTHFKEDQSMKTVIRLIFSKIPIYTLFEDSQR